MLVCWCAGGCVGVLVCCGILDSTAMKEHGSREYICMYV